MGQERHDERDLILRSLDTLEKVTGRRPTGMRSPSTDSSENTLALIREPGFATDSSQAADDDCCEPELDGEPAGVVEIPFDWVRDDAPYVLENVDCA